MPAILTVDPGNNIGYAIWDSGKFVKKQLHYPNSYGKLFNKDLEKTLYKFKKMISDFSKDTSLGALLEGIDVGDDDSLRTFCEKTTNKYDLLQKNGDYLLPDKDIKDLTRDEMAEYSTHQGLR